MRSVQVLHADMAAHEGSEQQYSLRIGDTVLLYAKEVLGYVFSEVSRYLSTSSSLLVFRMW